MQDLRESNKSSVRKALHHINSYWISDVSFAVLLGLLIFTTFVLPVLIEYDLVHEVFVNGVFLFLFFTGIWSSRRRVLIIITATLFVFQLLLRIFRLSEFEGDFYLMERIMGIVNMIIFIMLNIRLLFRDDEVSVYRVIGAVNVYLLVGLLGALVFEIIQITTGEAISGTESLTGGEEDLGYYIYFSLSSLTTVGFGDFYPVQIMAKMVSSILSTIGILYPAVVIAKLVSISTHRKSN